MVLVSLKVARLIDVVENCEFRNVRKIILRVAMERLLAFSEEETRDCRNAAR